MSQDFVVPAVDVVELPNIPEFDYVDDNSELLESFKCLICHSYAIEPVRHGCQALYCLECFLECNQICAQRCNFPDTFEHVTEKSVLNTLDALKVTCRACKKETRREFFNRHVQDCEFSCPRGCGTTTRGTFSSHDEFCSLTSPLIVGVIGQTSQGKSYLVNQIIKKDLLPMNAGETTKFQVILLPTSKKITEEEISLYSDELDAAIDDEKSDYSRKYTYAVIERPELRKVAFIDLPGLGIEDQNYEDVFRTISKCDLVVYVITEQLVGQKSVTEQLKEIKKHNSAICIALNVNTSLGCNKRISLAKREKRQQELIQKQKDSLHKYCKEISFLSTQTIHFLTEDATNVEQFILHHTQALLLRRRILAKYNANPTIPCNVAQQYAKNIQEAIERVNEVKKTFSQKVKDMGNLSGEAIAGGIGAFIFGVVVAAIPVTLIGMVGVFIAGLGSIGLLFGSGSGLYSFGMICYGTLVLDPQTRRLVAQLLKLKEVSDPKYLPSWYTDNSTFSDGVFVKLDGLLYHVNGVFQGKNLLAINDFNRVE